MIRTRTLGQTAQIANDAEPPFQQSAAGAVSALAARYPMQTLAVALIIGAMIGGSLLGRR
jgi:hypothetical protein